MKKECLEEVIKDLNGVFRKHYVLSGNIQEQVDWGNFLCNFLKILFPECDWRFWFCASSIELGYGNCLCNSHPAAVLYCDGEELLRNIEVWL